MTGLLLTTAGLAVLSSSGLPSLGVPSGEITVRVQQQDLGVAPHAVTFEVDSWTGWDTATSIDSTNYNPCYRELVYLWDFDDPTAPNFTATNLRSEWADSNKAYGFAAAHVYKTAGTYYPSCLVIEPSSGKSYTWTHPTGITVADPDTFFSAANTFYVDHTGAYTSMPSGATGYTSLATALGDLDGRTSPTRVMVASGHTESGFSFGTIIGAFGDGSANFANGYRNFYIAMEPGYTTRAEITCTGKVFEPTTGSLVPRSDGQLIDFVLQGINFTGPWDSVRLEGSQIDGINFGVGSEVDQGGAPDGWLITDCRFDGFKITIVCGTNNPTYTSPTRTPRNTRVGIIHNSVVTNWADWGVFGTGSVNPHVGTDRQTIAFLGLEIVGDDDAATGWRGGTSPNYQTQAPWRGGFRTTIVDGCAFFGPWGWSGEIVGSNNWTGGRQWASTYRQPAIRYQINGPTEYRGNFQRCYVEGLFGIQASNEVSFAVSDQNTVIEKSLFLPSVHEIRAMAMRGGGITVRNNVFLYPNLTVTAINQNYFIEFRRETYDANNSITFTNNLVEHNTFVNLLTTGSTKSLVSVQVGSAATVQNNLNHQPGPGSPIDRAPVALSGSAITPFNGGFQPHIEYYGGMVSDYADAVDGDVENGQTLTIPYSEGDNTYFRTSADVHLLRIGGVGDLSFSNAGLGIAWGASSLVVTNNTGSTWSGASSLGAFLLRDPDHYPPKVTDAAFGAGTVGIYAPTTGSSAIGGAGTSFPRFDILGSNRKTIIDGLTRTNATLGAVEVNLES